MRTASVRPVSRAADRGVTLVEALVALAVLALVLASFLVAFTRFQKAARVQADVASATEDLRHIAAAALRVVRMAGCGGLPIATPASEGAVRPVAVDIVDNHSSTDGLVSSLSGEPWRFSCNRAPVSGSDVLRLRGVTRGPVFDVGPAQAATTGQVSIPEESPWTGQPQRLEYPRSTDGRPFLLTMRAPLEIGGGAFGRRHYSQYRIVTVTGDAELVNGDGGRALHLSYDASGFSFLNPFGATDVDAQQVVGCGFVNDEALFIAANNFGEPSLYRVRVTRSGGRFVAEEMVPNVCDLQVAFGCDIDGNGEVRHDEWFLSGDRPGAPTEEELVSLMQLRLSLVMRSQSRDLGWRDGLEALENSSGLEAGARQFRYRSTTMRVNLRSHPGASRW